MTTRTLPRRSAAHVASVLAVLCLIGCPKKEDDAGKQPAGATGATGGAPTGATGGTGAEAADIPPPPDVATPPADATKTASGLASKVLKASTSTVHPAPQDSVEVHYTGWTTDGKMFDSSVKRGQPATFPLKGVIPGWTEGLQLMGLGEKRRFWIPENLAYAGKPGAPQGMLVFDVELLKVFPGPKPIPAPEDVKEPPKDAKKTEKGVYYKVLTRGTGKKKPALHDTVVFHFVGWTTDGNMFDTTFQRGQPVEIPLARAFPGWVEALQTMVKGEKARFWIPQELNVFHGRPGAPQGMLVFDLELQEIKEGPKPIAAPADVKAPPKDAKKTASGLAYKVLKKGTGKDKPAATAMVEVHYTGWTTDGQMFDSSVQRGKPAIFGLGQVILGWTEGLQLMVEGEKTRLWIPEELAYKGQPGFPKGMLVFDVELIDIK